ncbi:ABC transporter ATP-binding protein [Amycolatopsis sp. NPDC004368]
MLVVVGLVAVGASLALPGALASATDAVVSGNPAAKQVAWLVIVGGAEIVADVVGGVVVVKVTSSAGAWLRRRMIDALLAQKTKSPFAEGDAVSRMAADAVGAGAIVPVVVQLVSAAVISVGAIVLLAALDWRLALVFLGSIPLALLLARSHLKNTADDVLTYQRVSGELAARLLDATSGLATIAASGTAGQEAERVLKPLPRLNLAGRGMWRTQAKMVWRAALLLPAVELAALAAAGFGVLGHRLTVGDVLAALGYVALGLGLVTQIPLLTTVSRARGCAERVAEVLDAPTPERGKLGLLPGNGTLTLDNAAVHGALHPTSLTIPAGSFTTIVGKSGSGKSTVVNLLGGLTTPDAGAARLDGRDLTTLRPEELRAVVGYAFARPHLLTATETATVADAVGYGSWAGHTAVRAACRSARIHDVITRLPHGYHTPLAETPLSGGEAARVGLARAIVHSPRVLLLDDATASLDTVTEQAVLADVRARTLVVVTHRAALAARADTVLWLDAGRLRAAGSHHELWRDPAYRAVFTEEAG